MAVKSVANPPADCRQTAGRVVWRQAVKVRALGGQAMAGGKPSSFSCPACGALYQVVKVEAGPESVDREIACRTCGAEFPGRDGELVVKYFLLRKAARIQKWRRA
jgi:hypothetical protein